MRFPAIMLALAGTALCAPVHAKCPVAPAPDQIAATLGVEQASGTSGHLFVEDGGNIYPIFYTQTGNRAVFEGDIVLGSIDEIEALKEEGTLQLQANLENESAQLTLGLIANSVLRNRGGRWSSGVIPYTVAENTPNKSLVLQAMQAWSEKTGLKFVKRVASNAAIYPNYVAVRKGTDPNACYSETIGMKGGEQYVELVNGCGYGQILHEFGHVIGLSHEQNRADRGKFVKINTENIWPNYVYAFQQRVNQQTDVGIYDFDSIMHYEKTAFSCNGKPTIEALDGSRFGQRDHLSNGDVRVVKAAYNLP